MRNRTLLTRIISLILVLSLLLFGSTACGTEWESLALELLGDWADVHDVNPSTVDGATNLAKRTASGSTGDEEADAAIGLVKTVKDIQEGDKLMGEGEELRAEGKPEEAAQKMDAAIKKRPNDWSYRISRSALAYEQNETVTAGMHFSEAIERLGTERVNPNDPIDDLDKVPHPNPAEEVRFYTSTIDELESSNIKTNEINLRTKQEYYHQLSVSYMGRYEATRTMTGEGDIQDYETADHYMEMYRQTLGERVNR